MIQSLLQQSKIDPLDAELLLANILKCDRSWLMAHGDDKIGDSQKSEFETFVNRRKNHEPIAYIIGEKEFYGRKFKVDKRVLIPRPATETLIDEIKYLSKNNFEIDSPRITQADNEIVIASHIKDYSLSTTHYPLIVDVGTGSGCIAVTLALEIPDVKIIATDISDGALEVAKQNAELHDTSDRVTFSKCNLLPDISEPFLIVSNPPYIPDDEKLMEDVIKFEPHGALFGGEDGMEIIESILDASKSHSQCIGYVMEMRQEQAKKL